MKTTIPAMKPEVVNVRLVKEPYYISSEDVCISTANHAIAYFGKDLSTYPSEAIEILYLNSRGRPIYMSLLSRGNINSAIVPTKEILRVALLTNAYSMIMIHNHPSGYIMPSREDKLTLKRLEDACKIMGYEILDSIIVGAGNEKYYSVRSDRECYFCPPSDYVISQDIDGNMDEYLEQFELPITTKRR